LKRERKICNKICLETQPLDEKTQTLNEKRGDAAIKEYPSLARRGKAGPNINRKKDDYKGEKKEESS